MNTNVLLGAILLVTWSAPVGGPAPTGYKLCVGTNCIDAGNVLQKQTPNIDLSTPQDITVKAYNQYGETPSLPLTVGKPYAPAILDTVLTPG